MSLRITKKNLGIEIIVNFCLILFLSSSCNNNTNKIEIEKYNLILKELEASQEEIQNLKSQLDDILNTPYKLLTEGKMSLESGDLDLALSKINLLLEKHPLTMEATEGKKIFERIEYQQVQERIKDEKRLKEEIARKDRELARATSKMRKRTNEFDNITWYRDKTSPQYSSINGIFLYFGVRSNFPPELRFRIQYSASDWLFIENCSIKTGSHTHNFKPGKEFERDHSGGRIWEWCDIPLNEKTYYMIQAIIRTEKSIIRFEGKQYYKDRKITNSEKEAFENVLLAFEALGGIMKYK